MAQETGYSLTLTPQASDVPADVRFRRLLKYALRAVGLRCVEMRYQDPPNGKDAKMITFMNARQCAELIVNGLVGWSGPRADVAVDPRPGDRYIALAGDGNTERSVKLAGALRKRLIDVIANELTTFAEQGATKTTKIGPINAAERGQNRETEVQLG